MLTEALRTGKIKPVDMLEVCIRLIDEVDWRGLAEEEKESYMKRPCSAYAALNIKAVS